MSNVTLLPRPIHSVLFDTTIEATQNSVASNYDFYNKNGVVIGVNTYEEVMIVSYQSVTYSFQCSKGFYTVLVSNNISLYFQDNKLLSVKCEDNIDVLEDNTLPASNKYVFDNDKELDEIIF